MTQQPPPQPVGPLPVYADVFDLTLSPYGAAFRFGLSGPVVQTRDPKDAGKVINQQQIEQGARVYMSLEHLKALAFVCTREVLRHERAMEIEVKLPAKVIESLGCTTDEWGQFWYGWKKREAFGPSTLKSLPEPVNTDGQHDEPAPFPFPVKS